MIAVFFLKRDPFHEDDDAFKYQLKSAKKSVKQKIIFIFMNQIRTDLSKINVAVF